MKRFEKQTEFKVNFLMDRHLDLVAFVKHIKLHQIMQSLEIRHG